MCGGFSRRNRGSHSVVFVKVYYWLAEQVHRAVGFRPLLGQGWIVLVVAIQVKSSHHGKAGRVRSRVAPYYVRLSQVYQWPQ